jgi:hypothetical protein
MLKGSSKSFFPDTLHYVIRNNTVISQPKKYDGAHGPTSQNAAIIE